MTEHGDSYVKTQHHLTLAAAEAALSGAVAHAESLRVAAVIVVTDAAGGVTSLARLDGTPPIAIRHALAKASSASGLTAAGPGGAGASPRSAHPSTPPKTIQPIAEATRASRGQLARSTAAASRCGTGSSSTCA